MRNAFCFIALVLTVTVLQVAVFPAFMPAVLRPDVGLLVGVAALAFAPQEFALALLFGLGVMADLFGSARFGALTLSYMLTAGVLVLSLRRELGRVDVTTAWITGIAATLIAHLLYIIIGRLCGLSVGWGAGAVTMISLLIAAAIWGLPVTFLTGRMLFRLGIVTPAARERWAAQARLAAARKGKVQRGF